tara:strand:+ start:584 stop:1426 length:843 start_codon:yes stop_codon:yes gene_type:complete
MTYDCIVIGAGPAGVAAALHMKRAGLRIALFEKNEIGGLLRNAHIVENYLGFPSGISGKNLVEHLRSHIRTQNIELIREEVLEVRSCGDGFAVKTHEGMYRCIHVLVATGTTPKSARIDGESMLQRGKKLFYELCDLPSMKKKKIAIIGGGDVGFDYALHLNALGHEPIIIMKSSAQCLPLLKKRVQEYDIAFIEHCTTHCLRDVDDGVIVACGELSLQVDYVLIAVGRKPQFPQVPLRNTPGLYYIGDVRNSKLRQVHIATGDALRAAVAIIHSTIRHP